MTKHMTIMEALAAYEERRAAHRAEMDGGTCIAESHEGHGHEAPFATVAQLRHFLVEDNDWTPEEFQQFITKHADLVDGDSTKASYDQWEELAIKFDG